ncbi:PilN domain-containing protein [Niameybacter massiliensis]|uniref:PilN domain-containing protein n=1 Tax=Niameybacter massiliensis TaxID=1658108 RepID=UPI0006B567ED|nr:PilN domain-containing protein [Niameybacter massiliensis]
MLIKDINFFERYMEEKKRAKNISKKAIGQILTVSSIVIGTIVTASIMQVVNGDLQSNIDHINTYITSEDVARQSAEIAAKEAILNNAVEYFNAIETANQKLATIIKPDREIITNLTSLLPNGTSIISFSISGGNILLQCTSDQESTLATYVHNLRSLKSVFSVNYSGYQKNESKYTTSIQIVLNPGGEQDAAIQ